MKVQFLTLKSTNFEEKQIDFLTQLLTLPEGLYFHQPLDYSLDFIRIKEDKLNRLEHPTIDGTHRVYNRLTIPSEVLDVSKPIDFSISIEDNCSCNIRRQLQKMKNIDPTDEPELLGLGPSDFFGPVN